MIGIASAIKRFGALAGVDIQRIDHTIERARRRLFKAGGVDLVLDVGANRGQYGVALRRSGYVGKIVSFEPIPEAFEVLRAQAAHDPLWRVERCALGGETGTRVFRVSENLVSSSFLSVTSESTDAFAGTEQIKEIQVDVRSLVELIGDELADHITHLKLDTQGSELEILKSAENVLPALFSIESELSLVPLYKDQPLLPEVTQFLYEHGYRATWIERGFQNKALELLQVDALFRRQPS